MQTVNDIPNMPFHPRKTWKRRKRVDRIVVHTTASENQDPKKTARWHIKGNGWPGIGYHDFINKDGIVHRCNNYMDMTWHTKGWNRTGIGVALAYRGQSGEPPHPTQYTALIDHLSVLCLDFRILPKDCYGHREAPKMRFWSRGRWKFRKTCPGMGINLGAMRGQVTRKVQTALSLEGRYTGQIDGIFGPRSRRALFTEQPRST